MQHSIRKCLVPDPGFKLYTADFKQCELRVMAVLAKDEDLLALIVSGVDLYSEVAAKLYGCLTSEVNYTQRNIAKTSVLGMLYGQTPYGLAQATGIDEVSAQEIHGALWLRFPRMKQFIEETHVQAYRTGKAVTYFGRIRHLLADLRTRPDYALRLAVSHRVQSTAGDLMRIALVNLSRKLKPLGGRVLVTCHDELVFQLPESFPQNEVFPIVYAAMVTENEPGFPMDIDLQVGFNWGETVPV